MANFQGAVDTAANWASTNRTPLQDEFCVESDTGVIKIGDGATAYLSLRALGDHGSGGGGGNPASGEWIQPVNMMQTGTTGTLTSGKITFAPVDIGSQPLSIQSMGVNVVTARVGGTVVEKVGIYHDDGTGGHPLLSAGAFINGTLAAMTSTGSKVTTVSGVLQPGRYWVAMLYVETVAASTHPALTGISNQSRPIPLSNGIAIGTDVRGWAMTGQTTFPTSGTLSVVGDNTTVVVAIRAT